MSWGVLASAVDAARPTPAPEPADLPRAREQDAGVFAIDLGAPGSLLDILTTGQLTKVASRLGMTLPAMRAGHAKITKQPCTWPMRVWKGEVLSTYQPAWLAAPDPSATMFELLGAIMDDGLWLDRAYLRVTRRGQDGYPLAFKRVPASDVTDDDRGILINGRPVSEVYPDTPGPVVFGDGRILESVIPIRWQGLGGLGRAGSVIVNLSLDMLSAAANYAKSPLPAVTLMQDPNAAQLGDDEVDQLLTDWETKRAARSTAFLRGMTMNTTGFSAKELQLVEGREHNALEIARALALPAWAVESNNGASLQYSTTVEARRDLVEALRLWIAPVEQALSLHALPRGLDLHFDVTSYLRDDPTTRMAMWASGIASGVLSVEEARAQEPLAFGDGT